MWCTFVQRARQRAHLLIGGGGVSRDIDCSLFDVVIATPGLVLGAIQKKTAWSSTDWTTVHIFDHIHQLLQSSSTVGHAFFPNISSVERHIDTARVFVVLDKSATNETHARYNGMVILPWFSDHYWPWQGFRIRNSTKAFATRLGWSREKITLLESRSSTIHTQFRFTHIEMMQHFKAIVWVYFPRLLCTTKWLQLTQRTNSGRSRDWPKRTKSIGFTSQWGWTSIIS